MLTEQEFTIVADRHLNMLYHVALNCLRFPADTEDAVQETMLRLWRVDISPFVLYPKMEGRNLAFLAKKLSKAIAMPRIFLGTYVSVFL